MPEREGQGSADEFGEFDDDVRTGDVQGEAERRRPDLADPDSYRGVDQLGRDYSDDSDADGYDRYDGGGTDDNDPELSAEDEAFAAGGGSGGGIGGIGQLGDNLALGPVPDLGGAPEDDTELHELDDDGGPLPEVEPNGRQARYELQAVEAELNQRWPETKLEPSTTRIATLLDLLGGPHTGYPVIQVGGTNGKSSVARMVEALLTRMGLRVGRYTSPHLQLVTERISIDGEPISAAKYVDTYADVAPFIGMVDRGAGEDGPKMSKFEVLTGMAFAAFAEAPVEAAVLEVGMGGRWDATNVAESQIATITPIGIDHTEYLGDDLASIAAEKAGIINPDSVVVLAEQDAEVERVILERAIQMDVAVARQGSEFGVLNREVAVGGQMLRLQGLGGTYDEVFLPLHGAHQAANAALALASVEAFFGAGKDRQLVGEAVREAFAEIVVPGRLERVRAAPAVLLDAAHNPHGARALATAIGEEFAFRRLVGVIGVMADKDARGILEALEPILSDVVLTQSATSRAMPADELAAVAKPIFGEERLVVEPNIEGAVETAIGLVEQSDDPEEPLAGGGVLITGSVVLAGEARTLFGKEPV